MAKGTTETAKQRRHREWYDQHVLQGRTVREIAEEYGVHWSTVWRGCQSYDQRILQQIAPDARRIKVRHTLQLEEAAAEALRAWHQSKSPQRSTRQGVTSKGEINEVTEKDDGPEVKYLDTFTRCLKQIREIWGVDAPKKTALTDPTGELPPIVEIAISSRDEAVTMDQVIHAASRHIDVEPARTDRVVGDETVTDATPAAAEQPEDGDG